VRRAVNRISQLKIWTDCRGQDALEYALASGLIALAGIAAMRVYCSAVSAVYSNICDIILYAIR